jgi:hypothetical protein
VPRRLKPTQYTVSGCNAKCSLNPDNLTKKGYEAVHEWYQFGYNDVKIEDLARKQGMTITYGAIGRHRKNHLVKTDELETDEGLAELDDVQALDAILKRGQTQIKSWKISPSEYFKAMELKYRLTQGSTMDAMYAAMAEAATDDDEAEDRPEGVEAGSEGPGTLLQDVPVERPPSGAGPVVEELGDADEHPRTGEPVGEDVRHRDEAHLHEHLQGRPAEDEPAGVA